jgi:hypothetical protein
LPYCAVLGQDGLERSTAGVKDTKEPPEKGVNLGISCKVAESATQIGSIV